MPANSAESSPTSPDLLSRSAMGARFPPAQGSAVDCPESSRNDCRTGQSHTRAGRHCPFARPGRRRKSARQQDIWCRRGTSRRARRLVALRAEDGLGVVLSLSELLVVVGAGGGIGQGGERGEEEGPFGLLVSSPGGLFTADRGGRPLCSGARPAYAARWAADGNAVPSPTSMRMRAEFVLVEEGLQGVGKTGDDQPGGLLGPAALGAPASTSTRPTWRPSSPPAPPPHPPRSTPPCAAWSA